MLAICFSTDFQGDNSHALANHHLSLHASMIYLGAIKFQGRKRRPRYSSKLLIVDTLSESAIPRLFRLYHSGCIPKLRSHLSRAMYCLRLLLMAILHPGASWYSPPHTPVFSATDIKESSPYPPSPQYHPAYMREPLTPSSFPINFS